MESVTLISHINPDLDSSLALWILARFVFTTEPINYKFFSIGSEYKNSPNDIFVDIGGDDYDHHHIDDYVCASSLVIKKHKLQNNSALVRMVDFALKVDHGKLYHNKIDDFNALNIIYGLNKMYKNNPDFVLKIMFSCYDGIYQSLSDDINADVEIDKGDTFYSTVGKCIAFRISNSLSRVIAHKKGYEVCIYIDLKTRYRGYTVPGNSKVDFTKLYERVLAYEPGADWFLHSSKQMLLCGSKKAPKKKLSKLKLQSMVKLFKEIFHA